MSSRPLGLIGVPTSAGAFAPGQEQAPAALRAAGLVEALEAEGVTVIDHGDREVWRWRPDRGNRRAQNAGPVAAIARETAGRVAAAHAAGEVALVLGGDCTVGIGAIAGQALAGGDVGLLYFDTHADLNVPDSVPEGALDWMGLAHMLGEAGTVPEVAAVGARVPLLASQQVLLFAWGEAEATAHERAAIDRLGVGVIEAGTVRADPAGAAAAARARIESRSDRYVVHFDVDVIDFTDVPLSENWGRNQGLSYTAALAALPELLASGQCAGLTITEINPDHTEAGAGTLERFARDIARALARALG